MQNIAVVVVSSKPRFRTVGEVQADAFNRVTDVDIENRVLKLRTDVDVAVSKIDNALQTRSRDFGPIEWSYRSGGRIIGIR